MRSRKTLSALGTAFALVGIFAAACSSEDSSAPPSSSDGGNDGAAPDDGSQGDVLHDRVPYDSGQGPGVARVPVVSEIKSSRVEVRQLLFAAGEMQISGEPFANGFAGRSLADYDRTYVPPDQYILNNGSDDALPITDLFGFSTAVESYEYSKYHMNMVLQQTAAGVSLANGPIVATGPGTTTLDKLRARAGELLTNAGTDIGGYATLPAPQNNDQNYLGFPGLWPVYVPYTSFDPSLNPTPNVVKSCAFQGGYGGVGVGTSMSPVYECAYNTLHLPSRDAQLDKTIAPGVMGFAAWKEALWAIDFAGRIHDSAGNQPTSVNDSDVRLIGKRGNTVTALDPGSVPGTYIGSSPLEGMWGLVMLEAMDNAAEWMVSSLLTKDGSALGGFAKRSDALAYDYGSPLLWWPAAIAATEDAGVPYPAVTGLAIGDATSRASDLAAVLVGNAMFFGMTDPRNAGIGQRVGLRATFDGDPFPADDGVADGEATAHDRSLAVLRVAFVDLDRMHSDPALGVALDTATVAGGNVSRGSTASTTSVAHVVIALRQTLLSLNGSITQYGAPDPDPAADQKGILNVLPIHPPGVGSPPNFSARVRQLLVANASFVRDVLTKADGSVANSATIAGGQAAASGDPATLEAQAAAVRALIEGFLVTGDESLRDRARAVVKRLDTGFYSAPARMFRGQDGGKDEVHMNAERFAWLQSALRETYKVLSVPGGGLLDRIVLEDRIARTNKLFLNGWDDLNGNRSVDKPDECLAGRLQMAEQALTGELGRDGLNRPTDDRDGDCVTELSHAKNASVLASDVYFHSP